MTRKRWGDKSSLLRIIWIKFLSTAVLTSGLIEPGLLLAHRRFHVIGIFYLEDELNVCIAVKVPWLSFQHIINERGKTALSASIINKQAF